MNLIIDLALLALIILCTLKGRKRGLISGLIAVFFLIVALYASKLLADTYSGGFTSMIDPFISGIVDKNTDEAIQTGSDIDIKEQAGAALKSVGILRSAADNLAEDIAETTREGGYVLRNAVVEKLCAVYAYVLTASVVFILLIILYKVVANIISLDFKLPGLDNMDSVLGLVFGFIKGLVLVFAIAWLMRFTGLVIKEETVGKTILLKLFMSINPLIAIFGY